MATSEGRQPPGIRRVRRLRSALVLFCLVATVVTGCVQKTQPVSMESEAGRKLMAGETAERLWAQAEQSAGAGQPKEAIAVLRLLVDHFADHYLAPSALMKIGTAYQTLKEPVRAREAFVELVDHYPTSFLVTDARVQILSTYYSQGDFDTVIDQARRILSEPIGDSNRLTVLGLLGDTYLARDDATAAARIYAEGLVLAEGTARGTFTEKLTLIIGMMTPAQFESFRHSFPEDSDTWRVVDRLGKSLLYTRTAIGCVLPLSGRYEAIGQQAQEGLELALSLFLTDHPDADIQLLVRDSQGDPAVAARMVSELTRQGAAAIIGPIVTAAQGAAAAQTERIPIVVLTQKQGVTDTGDYVFRNFLTPEMQCASLVAYARDRFPDQRFAVIFPDEPYGRLFLNRFWDTVADSGGQVVGVETYKVDQTDFAKNIKRLTGMDPAVPDLFLQAPRQVAEALAESDARSGSKTPLVPGRNVVGLYQGLPEFFDAASHQSAPTRPGPVGLSETADESGAHAAAIVDFDAVFIPDSPAKAGLLIPQLAYYDVVDPVLFGTNLWHSTALIDMSRDYVQGAVFPDGFFADSTRPQVRKFVQAFSSVYDRVPGFIEAISYDTGRLLMSLVIRDDIQSRDQLRDALMAVSGFPGVTGTTAFDYKGEAHKDPFLLTVSHDRIQEAAPLPNRPAMDDAGSERP